MPMIAPMDGQRDQPPAQDGHHRHHLQWPVSESSRSSFTCSSTSASVGVGSLQRADDLGPGGGGQGAFGFMRKGPPRDPCANPWQEPHRPWRSVSRALRPGRSSLAVARPSGAATGPARMPDTLPLLPALEALNHLRAPIASMARNGPPRNGGSRGRRRPPTSPVARRWTMTLLQAPHRLVEEEDAPAARAAPPPGTATRGRPRPGSSRRRSCPPALSFTS
jgi:hypothetical protein